MLSSTPSTNKAQENVPDDWDTSSTSIENVEVKKPLFDHSVLKIAKLPDGKPDQKHHREAVNDLTRQIEETKVEIKALRTKLKEAGPLASSPEAERWGALTREMQELKRKQAQRKASREEALQEMKRLQGTISTKIRECQAAKTRALSDSVSNANAHLVARLRALIRAGNMRPADERLVSTRLKALDDSQRHFEALRVQQEEINSLKAKANELTASLEDPEADVLSQRFRYLKNELNLLTQEHDESYLGAADAKRNALWDARRERQAMFQKQMDNYQAHKRDEREKRKAALMASRKTQGEEDARVEELERRFKLDISE